MIGPAAFHGERKMTGTIGPELPPVVVACWAVERLCPLHTGRTSVPTTGSRERIALGTYW